MFFWQNMLPHHVILYFQRGIFVFSQDGGQESMLSLIYFFLSVRPDGGLRAEQRDTNTAYIIQVILSLILIFILYMWLRATMRSEICLPIFPTPTRPQAALWNPMRFNSPPRLQKASCVRLIQKSQWELTPLGDFSHSASPGYVKTTPGMAAFQQFSKKPSPAKLLRRRRTGARLEGSASTGGHIIKWPSPH